MTNIILQKTELPKREEWILQLANVITDPIVLFKQLNLDPQKISADAMLTKKQFALRVPQAFVARMAVGDYRDPLLLQVMLDEQELINTEGFSDDPLDEQQNEVPGLLHKYHNRALLITKTSCAINCRYCFRRHFPYQDNQGHRENWQAALEYIATHPELDEIILSGGDPLMAKDHELDWLMTQLEGIAHVKRLRIHTRLAVVIPARMTETLCQRFSASRLQVILVTHINHPNEIDDSVAQAMVKLKAHQVTLLNQSVLLKDINDNAEVLAQLSNKLFAIGILPYYLHVLDKVQGAGHFLVADSVAQQLMRELCSKVSGYLVPKLAREIGGEKSKTLLSY